jgi:hypothetical protein
MSDENFANFPAEKVPNGRQLAPFVEVQTSAFRGVAENFYQMPVSLVLAIKEANTRDDGSDIFIFFDAAEIAFTPEDFDRLQELNVKEFIEAIQAWVNASYPV